MDHVLFLVNNLSIIALVLQQKESAPDGALPMI
jgi:hypothetical protein